MTKKSIKIQSIFSKFKKIVTYIWTFPKKDKDVYNLKSIKIPRTSGRSLKILVTLVRIPLIRKLLIPILLRQGGLYKLRKCIIDDDPVMTPVHTNDTKISSNTAKMSIEKFLDPIDKKLKPVTISEKENSKKQSLFHPETAFDFNMAYIEGKTTPVNVAMRFMDIIRSIEESAVPLKPFVAWDEKELMLQAKESSDRFKRGESRGILDGVPIAVKDELDMLPFPTMVGTKFYNKQSPIKDSTVVERLRSAGALMVGKTNMHEIGIGVTGLNTKCGTTRNPHHLDHYPGGSASGSAAAVAAGLCPIALGVDGGGSIRIPASLCGVVGLKTTWGRVSSAGCVRLNWSLSTVGPISSTVRDTALAYSFIAGPDSNQISTRNQPPIDLQNFNNAELSGLKLGIFPPWFRHASADIVQNCEQMLDVFRSKGVKVEEIEIPLLNELHVAHLVTIATEMLTSMQKHFKPFRQPFSLDTLLNLTLAKEFTGTDYIKAQRLRSQMIGNLNEIFKNVDAIVTPATGITAPPILADALIDGESDLKTLTELMRYAPEANIGGFPAISFPVGYDVQGLPIGMQIMGRPWEESLLLRIANFSESYFKRHPPMMRFSLLPN